MQRALNVQWFSAKGDGVTDDRAAILAADAEVVASGGSIYFPPGTYLVSTSMTLTASRLLFDEDAILKPSNGAAITMTASTVTAGNWQILDLSLGGTVAIGGSVNVMWLGAKGDGATDDKTAIIRTIATAQSGGVVMFPFTATNYRIETPAGSEINLITITKPLTFLGTGGNRPKIKLATTNASVNKVLFPITHNGITVFDNLTIEGPDSKSVAATEYRCLHHNFSTTVNAGTLRLNNISSTRFDCFLKTELAAARGDFFIYCSKLDISNNENADGAVLALPGFLIGERAVIRAENSKFVSQLAVSGTDFGYHWYIRISCNYAFINCEFGRTWGNCIANHGGTVERPDYCIVTGCTFYNTVSGRAAIECNEAGPTQITNCSFDGTAANRGLICQGDDVVVSNCFFNARGSVAIEQTAGAAYTGTRLKVSNSIFYNSYISIADTLAAAVSSVRFISCDFFEDTQIAAKDTIFVLYQPNLVTVIENCTFTETGTTNITRFVRCITGDLVCRNNRFNNDATIFAIRGDFIAGTAAPNVFSDGNYFANSATALAFSGGTYGRNTVVPRRESNPNAIASASSITWDVNYDLARITGAATINTISFSNSTVIQFIDTGQITLVPDTGATWDLGAAGNILADAGARTVNRGVVLRLVRDTTPAQKFIEVY